jgi:hypothetical protein
MAAANVLQRARASFGGQPAQPRRAANAPGEPATLMSNAQRRMAFALVGTGLGWVLVGLAMPPTGFGFWLAFAFGAPVLGGLGAILGGTARARALDVWLLTGGAAQVAWQPPAATALTDPLRRSLQLAATPAVLGELLRAASGMKGAERAAAERLLAASSAAWTGARDDAARLELARDLPGLVAGLVAGGPAAVRAADDTSARIAPAAGGAR